MLISKIKLLKNIIGKLNYILEKKIKVLGCLVLFMSILNSFMQMLGVSVIVPLVSAMTSPQEFMNKIWVQRLCNIVGLNDFGNTFIFICSCVLVVYLIKDFFCIFQVYISTKYSNKVYREISFKIMDSYMHKNYDFFSNYSTPKIMRDVLEDTYGVHSLVYAWLSIITEMLTILMILIYIFISDPLIALCISALAFICLIVIDKIFKKKACESGGLERITSAENKKVLMESIEGIKELQVMKKQQFFLSKFKETFIAMQKPKVVLYMANTSPTYAVEGIFVSGLMLFLAISYAFNPSCMTSVPLLASFVMGAIRMLPSLSRVSIAVNGMAYYSTQLNSVYEKIHKINRKNDDYVNENKKIIEKGKANISEPLIFKKNLSLTAVYWRYNDFGDYVLQNLNMKIYKGESIGIIGASGAGKSTLADIILGLYKPLMGRVCLDGIEIDEIPYEYSRVIGYVPQTVYLIDGSIRENIAFGVDNKEISNEKIWNAIRQAQLYDFVSNLSEGIDTIVGERGVRFSGGQKQRIAIARALYREPQILILDEATSALDNNTEKSVMDAIEGLYGKITMVIIAHRLTTVKKCDKIFEIIDGKAVERLLSDALYK